MHLPSTLRGFRFFAILILTLALATVAPAEDIPGGLPSNIPGGPPNNIPGGPQNNIPGGPPSNIPGGPPNDIPGGPPSNIPGGPPSNIPGGPPSNIPGGPPNDIPGGPPSNIPGGPNDIPGGPPNNIPGGSEATNSGTSGISQNQDSYTCQDNRDHGKQYTTGGVTFELRCGHGTSAARLEEVQTATLKDCADTCANNPQCQSCDWANGICALKSEYIETFPYNVDTWFPIEARHIRTCPAISDRLSTPQLDAQIVANPKCPDDNGNIFLTDDGAHYTLLCCTHNPETNSEIPNTRSTISSFKECASQCSSTSDCQSYVYSARANTNDAIGTCKLYSSGSFQTTKCGDDTHDYAYITAPPALVSPDLPRIACATECPFSDGQQYKSKGGEIFHMDCAKRHGTQVLHEDTQKTFKDCMDACSKFIPCHSVDYHTNSKICLYGSHHGEPEINARGFQSAHSLGCSGACDGNSGSCDTHDNTGAVSV